MCYNVLIKFFAFKMKQILLRTYTVLVIVHLSFSYNIPSVDFIIYPKGFSISIPDEQGIEIVFFYGSVDKVICNFQTDSIIMTATKSNGEKWILENNHISLKAGQVIYYWLHVKKDGVGYTKYNNFYNVTDIFPYNSPDPTLVEPNIISSQVADVTTKPRINLDPYHIKPHVDSAMPSVIDKPLPTFAPTNPPVNKKPLLNLDPYYITPKNTDTDKLPFTEKVPLNLDPVQEKSSSEIHIQSTQLHHFNNLSESIEDNCTSESEGEISNEPLPLKDNSKEISNKCKTKLTSNKFSSDHPPKLNHNGTQRHKWNSHQAPQATTEKAKIYPAGETWYWN